MTSKIASALTLVVSVLFAMEVHAVKRQWVATTDNKWSTAANWEPAGTPVTGDHLVFPFGTVVKNTVNDLDSAVVLDSASFIDTVLVSGNPVRISNSVRGPAVTFEAPIQAEGDIFAEAVEFAELRPNGHTVTLIEGIIHRLAGTGQLLADKHTRFTGSHPFTGTISALYWIGARVTLVNASLPSATFRIGGRLVGSGEIGRVEATGWIQPSTQSSHIGSIRTGDLSLITEGSGAAEGRGYYEVDLASSGNDVLSVTGSVALVQKPLIVNLGFRPAPGREFVIVENDGRDAVTGTFYDGIFGHRELPEGSTFVANGQTFRITYGGGDGNDIVLIAVAPTSPTSTTINTAPSSAIAGQPVEITAAVSSAGGAPTGIVTFFDGTASLGTASLSGGVAKLIRPFTAGSHQLTAKYEGAPAFDPSTSPAVQLIVEKALSQVSVQVEQVGPTAVSLVVVVSASGPGPGTPTGTVVVRENSAVLASVPLVSGRAQIELTLGSGPHTLIIEYSGDASFKPGSASVSVAIEPPSITIDDASVGEGDAAEQTVTKILLTLSRASTDVVSVRFRTNDATATAGQDYESVSGWVSFAPGQTEQTISVTVFGDDLPEDDESLSVSLFGVDHATLTRSAAKLTILDDDDHFQTLRDIQYADAGGIPLLLDLRIPLTSTRPLPVIVAIHAGDWSTSHRRSDFAARLAKRGYAVATIDFRPPAQTPFPAQLDDVRAAIRWVRDNTATFNFDPRSIAVWGLGTAGGHLAALVGSAADVSFDSAGAANTTTVRVQAVVVAQGVADLLTLTQDSCVSSTSLAAFLGCDPSVCPAAAQAASPITHVSPDDPPFLILHAPGDCRAPAGQSEKLDQAIREVGGESVLRTVPVTRGAPDWSDAAVQLILDQFLDQHLQRNGGRRRATRK